MLPRNYQTNILLFFLSRLEFAVINSFKDFSKTWKDQLPIIPISGQCYTLPVN